jgi:ferritin-like metal-binding protein YciE
MALDTLQDLLVDQLKDLLSAEKQLVQALPKMAKAAQSPDLQSAFQEHLAATENHVTRLEQAFGELGESARAKKCKGMEGLIEEGSEVIDEKGDPDVRDAGLIAAAQRVEHYEIAAYGTVQAIATQLGLDSVAQLMEATLNEEKEADRLLSEIAQGEVNLSAETGEAEEEEEGSSSPAEPTRSTSRKRSPARSNRSRN